jgi:hypothetical protein
MFPVSIGMYQSFELPVLKRHFEKTIGMLLEKFDFFFVHSFLSRKNVLDANSRGLNRSL